MGPILGRSNSIQRYIVNFEVYGIYIYIPLIVHLKPVCPLFWGLNPPKEDLFQSKQGSSKGSRYCLVWCIFWICLGNFLMLQPLKQQMRVKFD